MLILSRRVGGNWRRVGKFPSLLGALATFADYTGVAITQNVMHQLMTEWWIDDTMTCWRIRTSQQERNPRA